MKVPMRAMAKAPNAPIPLRLEAPLELPVALSDGALALLEGVDVPVALATA